MLRKRRARLRLKLLGVVHRQMEALDARRRDQQVAGAARGLGVGNQNSDSDRNRGLSAFTLWLNLKRKRAQLLVLFERQLAPGAAVEAPDVLDKLLLNILNGGLACCGVGRHSWDSGHTDGDSAMVVLLDK